MGDTQQDLTGPPPKRLRGIHKLIKKEHFDENGRPRMCELYAGSAVMSLTMQMMYGWVAAMLAECATSCLNYLALILPKALTATNVEQKPWIQWKTAGMLALLIVAGVSCQPFSEAGPRKFQRDPRAWDAWHVVDAAVHQEAIFILLENVPNYVNQDAQHKVFTKLKKYAESKGFTLVRVLRPKHYRCGGETYRDRVAVLFCKIDAMHYLDMAPIHKITYNETVIRAPTKYTLDRTRDWSTYGKVEYKRGSRLLCFTTKAIVPGTVVSMQGSSRLWRVQTRAGRKACLMVTDRRASTRANGIDITKLTVVHGEDSEYKVFEPGEVTTTVRASGEPPGRGAPLICDGDGIWSCTSEDRAQLNDFTSNELDDMHAAGLTEEEITHMIGNAAPRLIMEKALEAIALILLPHCPRTRDLTYEQNMESDGRQDDAETEVEESSEQENALTGTWHRARGAAPEQNQHQIAVVPVLPQEHAVLLSQNKQPTWLQTGKVPTGRILKTAKEAGLQESDNTILVPAGRWQSHERVVEVIAELGRSTRQHALKLTLKQLHGEHVYPIASLALAKVEAHAAGYTTIEQIEPMLDITGEFAVGALTAKHLEPPRISNGVCTMTREQALQHCRAIERGVHEALQRESEALEETDKGLADYLQEWSQQVTMTDLRDVPDSLLTQIPEFKDHVMITELFSHTAVIPMTEAVKLPVNMEPKWRPESTQELLKSASTLAERDLAEKEIVDFFQLLYAGKMTEQELAKVRPEPRAWGPECMAEGTEHTVWDITGDKPVPVDFTRKATNHLRLGSWHQRFKDCDDQQLVSHLDHGVTTPTQLDLVTLLAAPLLSLMHGIRSVSKELKRMTEAGYYKKFSKQPTWPCFTTPIGARAKKGSEIFRKITDRGFPWVLLVTAEMMRVEAPNVRTRWCMHLPDEVKASFSDQAVDICTLRYPGDLLGWKIVQIADDMKDWFHQAANHISQHWMSCFVFVEEGADTVDYYQEVSMGMGYVHTSNVAQRFSNTILILWYEEFDRLDAPFLREERERNKRLDAYLEAREVVQLRYEQQRDEEEGQQASTEQQKPRKGRKKKQQKLERNGTTRIRPRQDRLHTGHIFTDDFYAAVLEPPHHSRVTTALAAWYSILLRLGIITARPEKRMIGASLPWTGIMAIACLALQVLPQEKVSRVHTGLMLAATGAMTVEEYNKLAGLVGFARYALALPQHLAAIMWEPLRAGHEKDTGGATLVRATARRRKHWEVWSRRLMNAHGAPCTWSLREGERQILKTERAFVWFQDAAIKGTDYPALGAYAHGLYWILPLTAEMRTLLSIAPLELLAILGSLYTFGNTLPAPTQEASFTVLMQSDSLTSTWKLHEKHGSSLIMIYILEKVMQCPNFNRLKKALMLGHAYGEGNPLADNLSRGDLSLFFKTCDILGVKPRKMEVPTAFKRTIRQVCDYAKTLPLRAP